jgi:NADH-quinone oxidoreductase subunit J
MQADTLQSLASWLMILLTIAFSLGVVFLRWPIMAAMSLIGSLLTSAVLFAMLAAPFIAVTQVLVYAGGILVLFIYILMLLGLKRAHLSKRQQITLTAFLVGLLGLTVIPLGLLMRGAFLSQPVKLAPEFGSLASFGRLLMQSYAYAFELMSVILVAVIVGVVLLTRRES